jgi:hypothetical protein
MVKPLAFRSSIPSRRCMICRNEDMSSWISDSLKMTAKEGERKPSALLVHRELRSAFPDSAPRHENSTRRHLLEHDVNWSEWVEES